MADKNYAPRTHSRFTDPKGETKGGQNGNKTGISLSTMILIQVGNTPVGAIQDLNISESRTIKKISEVGTDGTVDSAPSNATEISGGCTRIRFDRLRIAEAFGRGFTHVHSQRIPFDIIITDFFAGEGSQDKIITVLKNVWIKTISYTYSASDYTIADKMDWTAEAIYSYIEAGDSNVATGGEPGIDVWASADGVEQEADRGLRRGALDAPGLLRAALKQVH